MSALDEQALKNGAEAARELLLRRQARGDFGRWCELALEPLKHKPAQHHRLLIDELERVERGDTRKLMIFMPPGSAKSTYATKLFPAWFMARKARRMVIGASNTIEVATNFSREVQGFIADNRHVLGYGVARENAELWHTTHGCQYRAAGVGGTIASFRSDLCIIDDPIKNSKDAASEITREDHWVWFFKDVVSRQRPGGRVILIMTRWHEDDLGGRLKALKDPSWRIIELPATAKDNDPLGRQPGEMLWCDDSYGYGAELKQRKLDHEAAGAMVEWNALYEQDPRPNTGGIFSKEKFSSLLDVPPLFLKREVRAWDLAATEQTGRRNPDWTVGVRMGESYEGRFVVLDVVRMRGTPDAVAAAVIDTARMDGPKVRVALAQDPGQAGKAQVLYLTSKLRGFIVQSSQETGNKATRAMPFASQVNVGNVDVVRGPWNNSYIEELSGFPNAEKDDQVDASSRAFSALTAGPEPARWAGLNIMGR